MLTDWEVGRAAFSRSYSSNSSYENQYENDTPGFFLLSKVGLEILRLFSAPDVVTLQSPEHLESG